MRSAVFLHAIGLNERNEHVTRGVIIDHPTAFTMGEMGGGSITGVLAHNTLFRGGDAGRDTAMLLHSCGGDDGGGGGGSNEDGTDDGIVIPGGKQIGTSGVYEGGVRAAVDAADGGLVDPGRFKFFFNYVEFSDGELESMLNAVDDEGDAWAAVEVPPELVLDSNFDRGDAWARIRNGIREMIRD